MVFTMRTDFFQRAAAMNLSVACHVEMIADITETSVADMFPAAIFEAQVHALRRGRAMNDDKRNGSHRSMQELEPNTPASAVATATIDLRMMPHTDLDFVLM